VVLILLGIPVLVDTVTRFALQGGGTPAPVAPTQHLSGYAHCSPR
jgi:hypothetical protein